MSVTQVWGEGRDGLWTSNGRINVPTDYEYLTAGDAALTRAVKVAAGDRRVYVAMRRTGRRYPPRAVGIWAPGSVIAAERDRLAALRTEGHLTRLTARRGRRQRWDIREFSGAVRRRFPGCPPDEARQIAGNACEVGSGRVGRSKVADYPVRAAVVAHVSHEHTDYDDLLDDLAAGAFDPDGRSRARAEARDGVRDRIDAVLWRWEAGEPGSGEAVGTPTEPGG